MHYLTTSLLPSLTSLPAPSPTAPHQGRFLVGGRDSALPTVHLKGEQLHLLVYHAINSTMLLLLTSLPSPLLYSDLDTTLGPALSDLSADLTHQWSQDREASSGTPTDQVSTIMLRDKIQNTGCLITGPTQYQYQTEKQLKANRSIP